MILQQYQKMKNSDVEWIDEIPENWNIVRLGNYIKSTQLGTDKVATADAENGKFLLKMGNLTFGGFDFKQLEYVDPTEVENFDLLLLNKGNFLFNTRNSIDLVGKCAVWNGEIRTAIFNNNIMRIHLTEKINPYFLSYFLNSPIGYSLLRRLVLNTTSVAAIYYKDLCMVRILVPPQEDQKLISQFLDRQTKKIDNEIKENRKLIKLLKEKRQTIINNSVTKGLDPSIPMKDSGIEWIGDIPKHWKVEPMLYHVGINQEVLDENTDPDKEIYYIDIGSIDSTGEIKQPEKMKFGSSPSRARRIVTFGDTIVSTVRTYLRAIAFIDKTKDLNICSTGFAVLTPHNTLEPNFLYYLISSEGYINSIMANSFGVTYPAINSSLLSKFPCILPSQIEQKNIVNYLNKEISILFKIISKTENQIQKLQEYRQSLISAAVTGKIDVRQEVN